MISSQSRFYVVFGGAAGYLASAFLVLLIGYNIQIGFHFAPVRLQLPTSNFKTSEQSTVVPRPAPVQPAFVAHPKSLRLSDLTPKPPEMANDSHILQQRHLLFPLMNIDHSAMKDTFWAARSGGRQHEGVDILAPRNTPILAVEDGVIAKLWNSAAGGTTIYQFDPTNTYVYYYAHLERYAWNLKEGIPVRRGDVIGYVGTSGNAPPGTPHLHFAIYKVTEPGHWYHGLPINPFPIYNSAG
jgi:murein DD-endopeptidase MepM/ murein hydrolase activator NlpD